MNNQESVRKIIRQILSEEEHQNDENTLNQPEDRQTDREHSAGPQVKNTELLNYYKSYSEIAHGFISDVLDIMFKRNKTSIEKLEMIHSEYLNYAHQMGELEYPMVNEHKLSPHKVYK